MDYLRVSPLAPTQSPLPVPAREAPPPQAISFMCPFPGCERTFGTKTGRGVRFRRAHPHARDDAYRAVPLKARWTSEELSLLARREAELAGKGVRFINQALLGYVPGRTLESLKGVRRRADYRVLVSGHVVGSVRVTEVPPGRSELSVNVAGGDGDEALLVYFRGLRPPDMVEFRANTLHDICCRVGRDDRAEVLEALTAYLLAVFPPPRPAEAVPRRPQVALPKPFSRCKRRRVDFGRAQELWRRNPGRCYRTITGSPVVACGIPQDAMVGYWEAVMTDARESRPLEVAQEDLISSLWSPVTVDEVRRSFSSRSSAPGPDGLSARTLHGVHLGVLCRIYNLIMWCRRLPVHLRSARTVLIPKIPEPAAPGDFRPITVASVLVRRLHKILALKMGCLIRLDKRQRAFCATDGCADNVFLLDLVLRYHHERHRPLHLASVDVAKAFDTVSHLSILGTLKSRGCPPCWSM